MKNIIKNVLLWVEMNKESIKGILAIAAIALILMFDIYVIGLLHFIYLLVFVFICACTIFGIVSLIQMGWRKLLKWALKPEKSE